MHLSDLLAPDRVLISRECKSTKRALERLAGMLESGLPRPDLSRPEDPTPPSSAQILSELVAREQLGSTALGAGIAVPHARMTGVVTPVVALLRLTQPVDFDAPDDQPVDVLFGLLVPDLANATHLELLAEVARWFSNPRTLTALRAATDSEALWKALRAESSA